MANIKITELNGITKKASDDVLAIVDVSANETKKIAVEDLLDKNVELIAVSDTEPAECSYGDKYFNTTDNLIYTSIATDTWSEDGEEPISGILYIVYNEQASYSWNGTDLISVGGGKEDIVIDDTEPTDPDVKLWINTGEVGSAVSEITNEYSTSTGLGYSANYVNNLHTYSETEQRIGTWNGKPLYSKVIEYTNQSTWGATNTKTTVKVAHGIVNKGVIVKCSITNDRSQQFPYADGTSNSVISWTGITGIDNTDINIAIINDTWSSRTWYFTLEYTKTTD